MFGVTGPAGLWLTLAMESRLATNIRAHFLVAFHAQSILCLAVELHVALPAVVLPFHMTLNQFSRCDD